METKVTQVLDALKSGEAVLVYSELHESVDIRPKGDVTSQSESAEEE
jgi:uncharacterized protein YheU (UPF0270 family)